MHIKASQRRAEELKVAVELLRVRSARLGGARGYTVDEVRKTLHNTIKENSKTVI